MNELPVVHFVGVAGSGMSALAQIQALSGAKITGSDRLADGGGLGEARGRLEKAGIVFFPQDGSGVSSATRRIVVSTAIERDNPDLLRAQELGVGVVHRADELAALALSRRCVAVAGTSGKSTVSALIFSILESAGFSPSLACGANLAFIRRKGLLGNAWKGDSDLLVIEADESDGTLTRYAPDMGILLNISKDHKDVAELAGLFSAFRSRCRRFLCNADAPGLADFGEKSLTFGFSAGRVRGKNLKISAEGCRFDLDGTRMSLNAAGRHNAENALAAAAACRELGVPLKDIASGLAAYGGVSRRFEKIGSVRGVEVFDDYAHNPEKVRAAISAAKLRSRRVLAVFQLHGFAPARFLKKEFLEAFSGSLDCRDMLWFPEIYYAGGTAAKDISAADYAKELAALGKKARFSAVREEIAGEISSEAKPGDLVLVMGARDPSLGDFARLIFKSL